MTKPDSSGIPQWAEDEAWDALRRARQRVPVVQPDGRVRMLPEWQQRGAPSVGARAGAIIRNLMYPPSYIALSERALGLYLSQEQQSERDSLRQRARNGMSLV